MIRALLLTFAFALSLSTANADVPLPKNLKYIDPRVQFDGVEKHNDYVFYLRFLSFQGSPNVPYTMREVKDAKAFPLNAQRRLGNMYLLAVERKTFERRAKDDPKLEWLTEKGEGVLSTSLDAPATTGSINLKEVPVTTYRVTLTDGKLSANMVKDAKRSDAGTIPSWRIGLAMALAFSGLGIWLARRR